jgi:hypothetical protein
MKTQRRQYKKKKKRKKKRKKKKKIEHQYPKTPSRIVQNNNP